MFTWVTNLISKFKTWAVYIEAVGNAALHGGWSSITAAVSAAMLDNTKFNLTNGLKSEFDLLVMVFLSSGALAGGRRSQICNETRLALVWHSSASVTRKGITP